MAMGRLKRQSTRATAHIKENDHVTQTHSRTRCRSFSRRRRAGSLRRFRHPWGGGWGGGFHHRHFGHGFGIGYIGGVDDGCYVVRRVPTPFGYRLRTINVCEY